MTSVAVGWPALRRGARPPSQWEGRTWWVGEEPAISQPSMDWLASSRCAGARLRPIRGRPHAGVSLQDG